MFVFSCKGYITHSTGCLQRPGLHLILNWPLAVFSCQGYIKHSYGHWLSSAAKVISSKQLVTGCFQLPGLHQTCNWPMVVTLSHCALNWPLVVISRQGHNEHSTGHCTVHRYTLVVSCIMTYISLTSRLALALKQGNKPCALNTVALHCTALQCNALYSVNW